MLGLRRRAVKRIVTAVAAGLAILGWRPAAADPVADFYAHKSIRVLIGYSTGGGYDLYARELAKYMGKYIPGTPTLLPENMPGAGSLRAANYLYAAAPKDGTVIGTFSRGLLMEGLLNHSQGVMYDATKFTWLGSVTDEVSVCAFSNASGVQTWQDMLDKSYTIGGTASGADTDIYPTLIKNLFGLKLKLVTGFPGGADVDLALRRHEVDGRCGWSLSSLISRDKPLLDNHEIAVPVQFALSKSPELPDVPLVIDLTDDPKKVAVLKLIVSRQSMARPFAAPPGLPDDRAAALRSAFDQTVKDPDFLAEMQKLELEVRPVSGAALTKLVRDVASTSPDVLAMAGDALKEKR
jgi:tripartite-type tricarboxylate transporter receptor subunit TctC